MTDTYKVGCDEHFDKRQKATLGWERRPEGGEGVSFVENVPGRGDGGGAKAPGSKEHGSCQGQ